ncbi:hypothetical protein [Allopseudospirillum japonicum]|uniref:hypothetical protein n=1 Tax=Allopseudospirillum japonicum TaxID=64971 RepID=UPI0015A6D101|nr:hypothetical protein [Allopseudospirillum japonicum]
MRMLMISLGMQKGMSIQALSAVSEQGIIFVDGSAILEIKVNQLIWQLCLYGEVA